jgi:transketolase
VDYARIEGIARDARVAALHATHDANTSHVGSALSVIDILATLYGGVANISRDNLDDPHRDIVIVSKGHAASGVYGVLAQVGILDPVLMKTYSADGGTLGGHVTSHGVPGVELSTGSLGHGLPVGVGYALAAKRQGSPRHVYVVMSDGECDEGTTWESALIANHFGLDNLTVAIDRNGIQSLATTEETLRLEPFADKWRAFGWDTTDCDGHDPVDLARALSARGATSPRVVICKTTKGKGVSFMENTVLWHYRSPNDENLAAALAELGVS